MPQPTESSATQDSRKTRRRSLLSAGALVAALLSGAAFPAEAPGVAESTREMAALLAKRAAAVDPVNLSFLVNARRAEILGEQLQWSRPFAERLRIRFAYATELLNAGRVQACLEAIDTLEEDARKNAPVGYEVDLSTAEILMAMAYLRLAEEQNCHQGHNRESCLLPIRGGGVHVQREGSTRAIAVLETLLATAPDELTARWLLNVANMTLGTYPHGVPERFLISPSVFASEYALPRFDNVAREAGLDVYGLSGGTVLDDLDNDGLLDLLISEIGFEDQLRVFHNQGDGSFEDRTAQSGLAGEVGGLNLIQADYDNDGFVDVVVLRGGWMNTEGRFPFSLLHNDGGGHFTDVTRAAGLLRLAPSQTATWLDYDGDGWLDLFVGFESAQEGADPEFVHYSDLFHNNRNGSFTSVGRGAGIDLAAYVKGVVSGDYNKDGRPDIYVSMQRGANRLYRNDGPRPDGSWRFTNVGVEAGVTEPWDSFGTFFFDYDNDSWPDLFVAGYKWTTAGDVAADYLGLPTEVDRGRLFHNKGDGSFEDVTKAAGLYKVVPAMGLNFGDLDNDSFLDLYLATGNPDLTTLIPNRMFRNDQGRRFQDVTVAGNFGHIQKGHAVCFGDLDNDGDQDVFAKMGGAYATDKAYSTLYENPGNANGWLTLELEGVRSNRSAIGARIEVVVEDRSGVTRSIHRTVSSGGSFGASPLRQEIGLGEAARIVTVVIFWPATGQKQSLGGLQPNHRYRIREDVASASLVERRPFRLGGATRGNAADGPGRSPTPRKQSKK